jgi:hypothetical protein
MYYQQVESFSLSAPNPLLGNILYYQRRYFRHRRAVQILGDMLILFNGRP